MNDTLTDALSAGARFWLELNRSTLPTPRDVLESALRVATATLHYGVREDRPRLARVILPIADRRPAKPFDVASALVEDEVDLTPTFCREDCADAVFKCYPEALPARWRDRAWLIIRLSAQGQSYRAIVDDKRVRGENGTPITRMRACRIAANAYDVLAIKFGPMIDRAIKRAATSRR